MISAVIAIVEFAVLIIYTLRYLQVKFSVSFICKNIGDSTTSLTPRKEQKISGNTHLSPLLARHAMLAITWIWFAVHLSVLTTQSIRICQLAKRLRSMSFILCRISLFTVLYIRVKLSHQALGYKTKTAISYVLWSLVVLSVGSFAVYLTYDFKPNTCSLDFHSFVSIPYWINLVTDALSCICLLYIFVQPLKSHYQNLISIRTIVRNEKTNALLRIRNCCLISTISSIIQDVVTGIELMEVPAWYSSISDAVYSTDMMLNALSLLLVLTIWRQIFFFQDSRAFIIDKNSPTP